MKALVLGGSGLIGSAIVRSLVAQNYQVMVVGRRAERPANLVGVDTGYISGNVDDRGDLDAWIADHDIVVDAAAPYALKSIPCDLGCRAATCGARKETYSLSPR